MQISLQSQNQDLAVVAQLSEAITAALPLWLGSHAQLAHPQPIIQKNRLSFFLLYQVVDQQRQPITTILVKIARRAGIDTITEAIHIERLKPLSRAEFEALDNLYTIVESFHQNDSFMAVRPFAYLEPWNAIVVEKVNAVALRDLVFGWPALINLPQHHQRLSIVFRRIGALLHNFHQENQQSAPFALNSLIAECQQLCREIEQLSKQPDLCTWLYPLFDQLIMEDLVISTQFTRSHGDFHLGNLLITPESRVGMIDRDHPRDEPIYADIADLLVDLQARGRQVASYGWWLDQQHYQDYRQAFIRGYGLTERDEWILTLFEIHALLRKWRQHERRFEQLPWLMKPASHLVLRMIRRYVRFLIDRSVRHLQTVRHGGL